MSSDRDVLLSMGFELARVDCKQSLLIAETKLQHTLMFASSPA